MFELAVPVKPSDHILGPATAKVDVVEYGDFECPSCKQAAPAVKMLMNHFDGRIRFVYRHFPLEEVHPLAVRAAEAAECAGAQGKFWPMHDALFAQQPHLLDPELRRCAEELELDLARFDREMASHAYLARVRDQQKSGRDSGARGTPTFFVGRRIQDVSYDLHALYDAVDTALRA